MKKVLEFFKQNWAAIVGLAAVLAITGIIEYAFGRSPLGPDGKFGWWDGNIWGNENSQRVADVYSFSHIIHGMAFYGLLWLVAPKLPVKYRFVLALVLEAGWELLENSPMIIDRYRATTIAQGYTGDSVLNSVSDIIMAGIGFLMAKFFKIWVTVALVIAMELGCLWWVRDNLTLNIVMLVYPLESLKAWQSAGHLNL